MIPVTLARAAELMDGKLFGQCPAQMISQVCTDSRQASPGALFFALLGEKADGHLYANSALQAGAVAAVVSGSWLESGTTLPGGCYIAVDDPLAALGRMGASWRSAFSLPVVGITGSAGKTTTREMLAAALETRFPVLASAKNYNTEIGVPVTLLDITSQHRAAVIEMAMRGPGQIAYLADLARPVGGIVTNIGVSHIELLGSRDAIASAKSELLQKLPADGWAVIPAEDDYTDFLLKSTHAQPILVGCSAKADYRAGKVEYGGDGCASFTLDYPGGSTSVCLRVPGAFQVGNALAAIAAAHRLGVPVSQSVEAIGAYQGFEKRSRVFTTNQGVKVFDDTYNANPPAMIGALESLARMSTEGRRIAAIGDMFELGEAAEEYHRQVGIAVARTNPDCLFTVGDLSRIILQSAMEEGYRGESRHFETSTEAADFLREYTHSGDIILVKGSRGLRMEAIVERLES